LENVETAEVKQNLKQGLCGSEGLSAAVNGRKSNCSIKNICPMKMSKTTLVLFCLTAAAVSPLTAQFQKGDWLLEAGFQTHLEGSFGKTDIDLSKGGFTYYDTDSYGLNVAVGRFFWKKKEMGLVFEENWSRQTSERFRIVGAQSALVIERNYWVSQTAGIYFRHYFDFGKGWAGGYLAKLTGGRTWIAYSEEEAGIEIGPYGNYTTDFGLRGHLFVAKTFGKHFGGRVSFGNIGYSLSTKSNIKGIVYSRFDFNLQNLINPNISIFWTFHGKSKDDRD
jgi:hypothetical protein